MFKVDYRHYKFQSVAYKFKTIEEVLDYVKNMILKQKAYVDLSINNLTVMDAVLSINRYSKLHPEKAIRIRQKKGIFYEDCSLV